MKFIIIALFSFVAFGFKSDALTQDIKEGGVKIDLPNDLWSLSDKQKKNSMAVYIFKRKPIGDPDGRQIIPNIAVIVEDVDKNMDAISYSVLKRTNIHFEVVKVYTHEDKLIDFENAIAYKGTYVDKGDLEHTIYIVHGINERKGLQFIFDTTTNVLSQVEGEFLASLKSIRK